MVTEEKFMDPSDLTDDQLGIRPMTTTEIQTQILHQLRSIRNAVYFFVWIVVLSMITAAIYWLYSNAWD
jgi:hypothetical protein